MAQAPTPIRSARMPATDRRRQIVEVATRVFARAGYVQASTAEIASQAGISEPTIYRHFASKQALYLAVLEQTKAEMIGAWKQIAEAAPDPLTALVRISTWYQQQLAVRPQMLELRFRSFAATDDALIAEAVREAYREVTALVRGLFEDAIARGLVPKHVDPNLPTLLFLALGSFTDVALHLGLYEELGGPMLFSAMNQLGALWMRVPAPESE